MKHGVIFGLVIVMYGIPLGAADFRISGLADTTVSFTGGAGTARDFSYSIEEYANLRLQATVGEMATFYGAFNMVAVSGTGLETAAALGAMNTAPFLASSSFIVGDNYASGLELERLYFRINSDAVDVDAGLMRLAFGYGQTFGPSDFLSHRNPLFPDARPRAILGASLATYPGDAKILVFTAAPQHILTGDDSFNSGGESFRFGISGENHWDWGSVQGLYSFESPGDGARFGRHRFGLSVKADIEVGFVADVLYTYNHEDSGSNGLAASAGFDYSFFDGSLYVLAEYLFSGETAVTAFDIKENLYGFSNRHYLYALALYQINDYTSASLACIAGLSDGSFAPILSASYDLFQGCTLSISGQVPLDQDTVTGNGRRGEFGPLSPNSPAGSRFSITAKVRLRF